MDSLYAKPQPTSLIEFWFAALESPCGILIRTDNPRLLTQKLYNARRDSGNPALEALTIRTSPDNPATEVWITTQKAKQGRPSLTIDSLQIGAISNDSP